jgi:hypothetical protein
MSKVASRLGRLGAVLGATSAAVSPTAAQSVEDSLSDTYVVAGTHITYAIGARQPWGWGLELRAGAAYESPANYTCSEDVTGFFYGGGALRFEAFPTDHARLVLAAQGGRAFASVYGVHGEAGLGFRWGREQGFEPVLGAELDISYAALALHFTPTRAEWNPSAGIVLPRRGISATRACIVAGRPQRATEGYAPLPALTALPRDARVPSAEHPTQVARIWGARARTEWASVPAFREVASQLAAVHAPANLIARCHEAARDELQHAMLAGSHCARFAEAHVALTREPTSARPVLTGVAGLQRLAVESWTDGCLGEGTAAACARAESQLAADHDVRLSQQRIASDEQAHAALAWDVLAWALAEGGAAVRDALDAIAHRPATHEHVDAQAPENLAEYGILTLEHEADLTAQQRAHAQQRLHKLLAAA